MDISEYQEGQLLYKNPADALSTCFHGDLPGTLANQVNEEHGPCVTF